MRRLWPMLMLPIQMLPILWMPAGVTLAAPSTPEALRGVEVTDHAGRPLDMGLTLKDEGGPYVLTDRFKRGKPTLLTFNYFRCRGVCDLQLRMISRDLPAWGLKADDDFNLVSLSFDPGDTPQTAQARKEVLTSDLKTSDPG